MKKIRCHKCGAKAKRVDQNVFPNYGFKNGGLILVRDFFCEECKTSIKTSEKLDEKYVCDLFSHKEILERLTLYEHEVETITFEYETDTMDVFSKLREIVDEYGFCRVEDYYNLAGLDTPADQELWAKHYGWNKKELDRAVWTSNRIYFPEPTKQEV